MAFVLIYVLAISSTGFLPGRRPLHESLESVSSPPKKIGRRAGKRPQELHYIT
jgi:hypothetical protein